MATECSFCGFETGKLTHIQRTDDRYLCDLCLATFTGSVRCYPFHHEDKNMAKIICYVGNKVLEKLDRK